MADVVQFVDSIEQVPNVLLDLNDEAKWSVRSFSAPTPRLRRAMSANAMRDGVFVSSSQYDARTLTIGLDLVTNDQDANALELQKLFRILDAPSILRYRPAGASKPVFFKVFRSDAAAIVDVIAAAAFRQPEIQLLAEPLALGMRETVGPFTVTNDPDDSNGCFFDVDGIIGDVEVPCVMVDTGDEQNFLMLARSIDPAAATYFVQAEDCTPQVDTVLDAGPDAVMSGGANLTTTEATTAPPQLRVSFTPDVPAGTYRLWAAVRRANLTYAMTIAATYAGRQVSGDVVIPLTTSRQIVDLGLLQIGKPGEAIGQGAPIGVEQSEIRLNAAFFGGSGSVSVDWDCFLLVPADEGTLMLEIYSTGTPIAFVIDGVNERTASIASGDPIAGTALLREESASEEKSESGSYPHLAPGRVNRFFVFTAAPDPVADPGYHCSIAADPREITVHYWPGYLSVRPASS